MEINKDTKLPISAIAVAISFIGGSIWTASEIFTRFEALESQVANEQAYNDAWIRKLSDDNMNKIIVLETKMNMLVTSDMKIVPSQQVGLNKAEIENLKVKPVKIPKDFREMVEDHEYALDDIFRILDREFPEDR